MQRRLAAIMVADFVGSTPAMESDEEGSVTRIAACMKVVGDTVARHDGRVFAPQVTLCLPSSPVPLRR